MQKSLPELLSLTYYIGNKILCFVHLLNLRTLFSLRH